MTMLRGERWFQQNPDMSSLERSELLIQRNQERTQRTPDRVHASKRILQSYASDIMEETNI